MRNKNLLKWVVYTLAVILIAVIQGTPHMLPAIEGAIPVIVIPCVISIAMFEGETAGTAFGILGGLLWDLESGRVFGFNALFLMIICIAVGLLIQQLFRNTIVSALIFCIAAAFIHEFVTWFFFAYLTGNEEFVFAFLRIILPTAAYTLIFILPFYLGARFVNRRFTKAN
jgi:rod shape-determining protein MreD